ncbi:MAG: hypothetical protein H7067_12610, partial [Burkholderiales bacterium]|nr:hypothetical protein [Opitutaceae bacterium]
YLAGHWRDESGERVAAYTLEWRRGQLARTLPFLHNPTVCLPLAGCELREERGTHVFRFGGLDLPFRSYLFSRAGEEFVISFIVWDPYRGEALHQSEDTPDLPSWLAVQWREVRERRRHQPAQMLCLAVYGADPETRTQELLETIVQARDSE